MQFILAQIFGTIALILTVISVQFKTKDKIVMCITLANVAIAIQFFLLNAVTGAIISILDTIRCIVFYIYEKKNLKPSLPILLTFEAIVIISGIISWQNGWSIIPVITSVVFTYGLWQDNITILRITTGMLGVAWGVYDFIVKAFAGLVLDISQLISAIISLYREKKRK